MEILSTYATHCSIVLLRLKEAIFTQTARCQPTKVNFKNKRLFKYTQKAQGLQSLGLTPAFPPESPRTTTSPVPCRDSVENAQNRAQVAFEFIEKWGTPYDTLAISPAPPTLYAASPCTANLLSCWFTLE